MAVNVIEAKKVRTKKWSDRLTIKFLELYEAEEVLWDVRSVNYKNRNTRDNTLQRIVTNLNIPGFGVQDVLKKINSVRSTFQQEKAKIRASKGTGSGSEDIYVPTLSWYDIAERFLGAAMNTRKTCSNVETIIDCNGNSRPQDKETLVKPSTSSENTKNRHTNFNDNRDIDVLDDENELDQPSEVTLIDDTTETAQRSISSTGTLKRHLSPTSSKKGKKMKASNIPAHIERTMGTLKALKEEVNKREPQDEFTFFGQNIACQLRQLPPNQALECQSEIMTMIQNRRMQNLVNNESSNQIVELVFHNEELSPNILETAMQDIYEI